MEEAKLRDLQPDSGAIKQTMERTNKGDRFREPQEAQLSASAIFVNRWATLKNNVHNYEGEDQWSHVDKTQGMAIIGQQQTM